MKTFLLIFVFSLMILQNSFPSGTYTSEPQIDAVRSVEQIIIDGLLTEAIWNQPGFSELTQQDPAQGLRPSQKSEFWVAYDDEAIYFAAKFYDSSPDSIMARLVRRDFIWGDPSDGCILYLDSYRDRRSGYFFYVSAAGTLADGLLENDVKQPNDLSWDAVWEGVPHIDDEGWSVEMRIPYSQLRFDEGDKQTWGINVERFISRGFETDMLVYTPRNESGFTSRFLDLVGIEGIAPPTRVEILPYVTGKAEYLGNDQGNPFNSGENYTPGFGLDVRAGLGSSLTLNGTVNPDFGQVELDPAIVNLSDVEYSFQEKRPFFTEGVSIYRFGRGGTNNNVSFNWPTQNIFYSRRIGRSPQGGLPDYDYADIPNGTHILGAAKITGQVYDNWKIGTIHALTQREYADIDLDGQRSSVEVEPLTYYGIFRAQRDFNGGAQGIGLLSTFTNRFFSDAGLGNSINKNALVVASDGWTFLDEDQTYVLTGWAAVSNVTANQERMTDLQRSSTHYFQRPDADHVSVDSSVTSLTGYSGRFMVNKNRGRWTFNTAIGFVSPKFELNDLGFGSYSDNINAHFFTSYRWNEPTDFYRFTGINGAVYVNYDYGGNRTAEGYWLGSYIALHDYSGGDIALTYNPSTLNSRRTRGGPLTVNPQSTSMNFNLHSDNRVWWVAYLGGNASFGKDGDSHSFYTTFEFKVLPTLTLSIGPEYSKDVSETQWVDSFTDPAATETYDNRYVFAHLDQTTFSADIRADWIISPKLSFQIYLQPFIASGRYSDYKYLSRASSYDFVKYGEGGSTLEQTVSEDGEISYMLDPDGEGGSESQVIDNPDFNYISFRGNAVLRWEYMPGSTLYLVWTQSRQQTESNGAFRFGKSFNNLFGVRPDNIFMLKLSYWL
ncbi:DUF5916 domain-containing protein [Bacteroidota bacterium]